MLWIPALVDSASDNIAYEGGAFRTRAEAQAVIDQWASEGRSEELVLNLVPLYESVAEWRDERG
jgi:hypothetical protein